MSKDSVWFLGQFDGSFCQFWPWLCHLKTCIFFTTFSNQHRQYIPEHEYWLYKGWVNFILHVYMNMSDSHWTLSWLWYFNYTLIRSLNSSVAPPHGDTYTTSCIIAPYLISDCVCNWNVCGYMLGAWRRGMLTCGIRNKRKERELKRGNIRHTILRREEFTGSDRMGRIEMGKRSYITEKDWQRIGQWGGY